MFNIGRTSHSLLILSMGAMFLCFTLGACSSDKECTPQVGTECEDGVTYYVNSCGEREAISKRCDCGCSDDGRGCGPCVCEPECTDRVCGPDGCGGLCPPGCQGNDQCDNAGQCVDCVPRCEDKQCGSDSCGGTCPPGCEADETCTPAGQCETCQASCQNKECGDDGCGGLCPPGCDPYDTCGNGGTCLPCQPQCLNRECGPDSCGGQCEPGCAEGQACNRDGVCQVCATNCVDRVCGLDGCGGSCGECAAGEVCNLDGLCLSANCLGQANTIEGLLQSDRTDIPFDDAQVDLGHRLGGAPVLDGCVSTAEVVLTLGDGCRLTAVAGGTMAYQGGLEITSLELEADAQCPGLAVGLHGSYRNTGGMIHAQILPGVSQVPDSSQASLCVGTSVRLILQGTLNRETDGLPLEVSLSHIVINGDFTSTGDPELTCPCYAWCHDRDCGIDGCGGSCGSCSGLTTYCDSNQKCVDDCAGLECGQSPNQAFVCGECQGDYRICVDNMCECEGLACGPECCSPGAICLDGECCNPSCEYNDCGLDGCGGSCGVCDEHMECVDDLCLAPLLWVVFEFGGTFMMGCPEDDGIGNEQPIHEVTVPPFLIMYTEATVSHYAQCVADGWCAESPAWNGCTPTGHPSLPINCLTKALAEDFCAWAGGRLPSEAEWEFAARDGGIDKLYPWGSIPEPDCAHAVMDVGTGQGCGNFGPDIACSIQGGKAVLSGMCDLSGNICEIVADSHTADYEGAPTDGSAWQDPTSYYGVCRGGSFQNDNWVDLTVFRRHVFVQDWTEPFFGVRCAADIPE